MDELRRRGTVSKRNQMPRLVLMFVTGLTVLNGAVDSALAQQTWQSEWEKTIAAAKKEGKVVVGLPPSAELRKELEPAFKTRFGFEMEIFPRPARRSPIGSSPRAKRA